MRGKEQSVIRRAKNVEKRTNSKDELSVVEKNANVPKSMNLKERVAMSRASYKVSLEEFKRIKKNKSNLADEFWDILRISKVPTDEFVREYIFHPSRKWRFDIAVPEKKVAIECDGMVWQAGGGRHNTDADREKMNTAVMMGWRVLRFSGAQIRRDPGTCIMMLLSTLLYLEDQ